MFLRVSTYSYSDTHNYLTVHQAHFRLVCHNKQVVVCQYTLINIVIVVVTIEGKDTCIGHLILVCLGIMACPFFLHLQKDNPLGSVDLFECTGIDRSNGKKGFGFDIKV